MLKKMASALLCLLPLFVAAQRSDAANIVYYAATIDTAFLSIVDPSTIDFQFSQGDPSELTPNTAEVTGLNVGGAPLDFTLIDGNVNGSAPAEYYFLFTSGPVISFNLALTAYNSPGDTPDLLSILIEDQFGNPVLTTDAAGSSVLSFAEPLTPEGAITVSAYDTPGTAAFNSVATEIPEPRTLVLGLLSFLLPAAFRLRRGLQEKKSDVKLLPRS